MPVSALIIFALFVQIAASKFCEVENDSMEFGYFSCYPRLNKFNQTEGPFQAFPLTVCILQCENSPFRYLLNYSSIEIVNALNLFGLFTNFKCPK